MSEVRRQLPRLCGEMWYRCPLRDAEFSGQGLSQTVDSAELNC